jgi:hypothetical protein
MGYSGQQFRMPMIDTGFRDDRNTQLLPPTALLSPSTNLNYHENGLSKRGGTAIAIASGAGTSAPFVPAPGQGIFQFRKPAQNVLLFAANGIVYQTNYGSPIKTGLSATNPVCFIQTSKYVGWADGLNSPLKFLCLGISR